VRCEGEISEICESLKRWVLKCLLNVQLYETSLMTIKLSVIKFNVMHEM
jgi:hypothetical protein